MTVLFWLLLPIGVFLDLWNGESFGLAGLKIMIFLFILRFLFPQKKFKNQYKIE